MNIHLVGVGGVAMGNLAAMLKQSGHTVTGSDHKLYPPMSHRLQEWGIDARPFDPKNVERADLTIIGNAISRGNPEVEEVLNRNLDYTSMSVALSRFFLQGKRVIVVAGTHGKTTTTFLMDHILQTAGTPPGLFAGGVRADGQNGFRVSSDSPYFVIEGDEYDTAFFDKHAKFLHYRPGHLILTSLEYDHADIYADFDQYALAFRRLLRLIPSRGLVAGCYNDPAVLEILEDHTYSPVHLYGGPEGPPFSRETRGKISRFQRKGSLVEMDGVGSMDGFSLIGSHNTRNALGAAIIALEIGIPPETIRRALQTFPGVLRRQQIRKKVFFQGFNKTHQKSLTNSRGKEIILMEDFAHHPTAVTETIGAVREAYPGYTIHALFEPRSASSHKAIFQEDYVRAFLKADFVYICDVFNREKFKPDEMLQVSELVEHLNREKENSFAVSGETPAHLLEQFKDAFASALRGPEKTDPGKEDGVYGSVILVMSNGAFGGIYPELDSFVESLEAG